MPITIMELEEKLKEAKSRITQKLTLTDLPFIPKGIRNILLIINGNEEVSVRYSEISRQGEIVEIKGEVTLHKINLANISFYFKVIGGNVELSANIPINRVIPLSLGITEVKLTDVRIEINSESEENKKAVLRGNVTLVEQTIELTRNLLGNELLNELYEGTIIKFSLNDLISTLCQRSIDSPMIPAITLQNAHFIVNPSSESASVNVWANVDGVGRVQLSVSKYNNSWEYIVLITLPNEWKLSSWSDIFQVFDKITIGEPMITLSSVTEQNASILDENINVNNISVVEGLYFNGILRLEGALHLLQTLFGFGKSEIPIGGSIGSNPSNTKLNANLGDLSLFGITFNDAKIVLQVKPFSVGLRLSTIVNIQRDELRFNGSVDLGQTGVDYILKMPGVWEHPFGLPMLDVSELFLEFQTSPAPALAVGGYISLGDDVKVKVICKFTSSAVPDTLIGKSERELSASGLIRIFTGIDIPLGFLDVSVSNADIYIVANPLGAIIDEVHYPFGFRVHGTMNAYGISTKAKIAIEEHGIYLDSELSPINVGDVLKIYGTTPEQGPKVVYRVVRGEPFLFQLDAGLQLLGVKLETHILINQEGFRFEFTERIFNAFTAHVIATGSGELNQGNFHIDATMQNDMVEFITNETRQALQGTASSTGGKVSNLEAQIRDLEQRALSLTGQMTSREGEITNNKNSAENAVQSARSARDNAQAALQNAEAVKNSAERSLNNARDSVDAIRREKANIEDDLHNIEKNIEDFLRNIPPKNVVDLKRDADRSRDLITETGKRLEEQENLVRDLESVYNREVLSFEEAGRALNNAVNKLSQAEENLRNIIPIEQDLIYIGYKTTKESVEASIESLRPQLEAARVIAAKSTSILTFIAGQGIDLLFNVTSIRFEGNIQNVGDGHVSLLISYTFLGAPNTLNIDFVFEDPRVGIQVLVDRLMRS